MRSDSSLHSELTKEAYYLPHQCQGIAFPNWPRQDQRELKETGRSGVLASGGEGAAMATGVAREELKRGDVRGRKAFGAWRDVAAGGGGDADEVGRSLPMPVPDGGRSLRREKAKGKGRVVEVREGWRTLRRERIAAAVGEDDEDDFAIDSEPEEEAGGEGQGEVGESDGDAEWEDAPDDEDSDDDEAEHPLSPEAAGHTYIPPSTDMRGKGRAKGKSAKQPCPHGRVMSCKACREAEKKLASSSLGSSVKMLPTILRKMKRMTRRV